MDGLVSIIIPCYNAENYIEGAIDSIEAQDYKNVEIICVDDGSSDATWDILKRLKADSSLQMIIYHIENQGVSNARNFAMKRANGEYVFFLDADDLIDKYCISSLIHGYESLDECDLSYGFWTSNQSKMENVYTDRMEDLNEETLKHYMYRDIPVVFTCYLYKREIILNYNLNFDHDLKFSEDNLFAWKYMCHINHAYCTCTYLYYYRDNSDSATKNVTWRHTDAIVSVNRAYKYMRDIGYSASEEFFNYMYPRMLVSIANAFAKVKNKNLYLRLIEEYDVRKHVKKLLFANGMRLSAGAISIMINPLIFYYIVGMIECFNRMCANVLKGDYIDEKYTKKTVSKIFRKFN